MLILASFGMVMAMIASSLAIDLGTVAYEARRDQLVADMAALDAVRVLPANPTSVAQASALRNNFPYTDSGYSLVVEWAPSMLGPFTSLPANLPSATVVRVTAGSPHRNFFPFTEGSQTVTRKSVSKITPIAGFTIGSSLLNINTSSSLLLNPLLSQAIGGGPSASQY